MLQSQITRLFINVISIKTNHSDEVDEFSRPFFGSHSAISSLCEFPLVFEYILLNMTL